MAWMVVMRPLAALFLLLTLFMSPALASSPAGRWVLRSGQTTLMVFEVERTPQGWAGSWTQPADYRTDGEVFRRVTGPSVRRTAREVRAIRDGVELVFDSPFANGAPDRIAIEARDAASARMTWAAYNTSPYLLTRLSYDAELGPWDADRSYVPDMDWAINTEMTAIYIADQAARADPATIDWEVVRHADAARRASTQALLDSDRLRSGDDFFHAAFVFQHGDTSADYLKAHALAIIAVARGRPDATWIAAATLDRYLQSIGQPQIYGTQFRNLGSGFTQEPYARDLLSDALRQASQVPTRATQDQQRRDWDRTVPSLRKP